MMLAATIGSWLVLRAGCAAVTLRTYTDATVESIWLRSFSQPHRVCGSRCDSGVGRPALSAAPWGLDGRCPACLLPNRNERSAMRWAIFWAIRLGLCRDPKPREICVCKGDNGTSGPGGDLRVAQAS